MKRNELVKTVIDLSAALRLLDNHSENVNAEACNTLRKDLRRLVIELTKFEKEKVYEFV